MDLTENTRCLSVTRTSRLFSYTVTAVHCENNTTDRQTDMLVTHGIRELRSQHNIFKRRGFRYTTATSILIRTYITAIRFKTRTRALHRSPASHCSQLAGVRSRAVPCPLASRTSRCVVSYVTVAQLGNGSQVRSHCGAQRGHLRGLTSQYRLIKRSKRPQHSRLAASG